ncbi:Aromatic di-alanine and TPR containing protein [Ceratobasidium theobromae]|uniref:Aromatic di-alanine and TPR containing protein n=1 Tax=Ceratobasidium theobromae TaxID=1582974 RepID=A0A5N5QAZ0_9AGAM|nr:Aromatic di-alanine and TPR containing protein [Ceratobasidium theobromae]
MATPAQQLQTSTMRSYSEAVHGKTTASRAPGILSIAPVGPSKPGLQVITAQPSKEEFPPLPSSTTPRTGQLSNPSPGTSSNWLNSASGTGTGRAKAGSSPQRPRLGSRIGGTPTTITMAPSDTSGVHTPLIPQEAMHEVVPSQASNQNISDWTESLQSILSNVQAHKKAMQLAVELTSQLEGATFKRIGSVELAAFRQLIQNVAVKLYDQFKLIHPPTDLKVEHDTDLIDMAFKLLDCTLKEPIVFNQDFAYRVYFCASWRIERSSLRFDKNIIYRAIELFQIALTDEDIDDLVKLKLLSASSNAYRIRYNRLGALKDANMAIDYMKQAIDFAGAKPDLRTRLPSLYETHGNTLGLRFAHTGRLGDMRSAIIWLEKVLGLAGTNQQRATAYIALGNIHKMGYDRLGVLDYINKAIEHHSNAFDLEADNPVVHRTLAESYAGRFHSLFDPIDIDKALQYSEYAYLHTRNNKDPQASLVHSRIWAAKCSQYKNGSGDQLTALQNAIQFAREAMADSPDPPFKNRCLHFQGIVHQQLFRAMDPKSGDRNVKIEEAINLKKQALENTRSNNDIQAAEFAASLGLAYMDKHVNSDEDKHVNNLREAVKYFTSSVERTPDDHPELPSRLLELALAQEMFYTRSRGGRGVTDDKPLKLAKKHLEDAMMCTRGYQLKHQQLTACFHLARLSRFIDVVMEIKAWTHAMAYVYDFIWMGLSSAIQHQNLIEIVAVNGNAVAAAIAAGHLDQALLWLSNGRAIVWNQQLLLNHINFQQFSNQPLLHRMNQLGGDMADSYAAISRGENPEMNTQKRHRVARDLTQCIKEAEKDDTFPRLGMLSTISDQLEICKNLDSTVIFINMSKARCDAISVHGTTKTCVPLGSIYETISKLYDQLPRIRQTASRGFKKVQQPNAPPEPTIFDLLRKLWTAIVRPVLITLGYDIRKKRPLNQRHHFTWCTTGQLTFLPIDWAGPYKDQDPNLRLLKCTEPPKPTQILLLSQENTPGYSPLPGAKREHDHLKDFFKGSQGVSIVEGNGQFQSIQSLIAEITKYPNFHVASHGVQGLNPLLSALIFTPGPLDLDTIRWQRWSGKRLAYLSACETAAGDDKLPDENLNIASGFLIAGFPDVIGTRWSVDDEAAELIAKYFYEQILGKNALQIYSKKEI